SFAANPGKVWIPADRRHRQGRRTKMSLQVDALNPRPRRGGVLASMLGFATLCVTLRVSAAPPPEASMSGGSASAEVSKVRTDVVVMAQNVAEGAMALQEPTPCRTPERASGS